MPRNIWRKKRSENNRQKSGRELHELQHSEMVKSGSNRLASIAPAIGAPESIKCRYAEVGTRLFSFLDVELCARVLRAILRLNRLTGRAGQKEVDQEC